MLELKNISKSYNTGDFVQKALNDVSLKFRKSEFVAILGPSGSGKTTLLNIIGGLDRYDHGDLIINEKSTKKFNDYTWDAYRNNSIGFIFQSYNLISHISILDNVEMGMTLSGMSSAKRREKAIKVLKKVGLEDHLNKKPNQLSGGQMQRVAIARALANNPDVILADEPTGALDSETSVQIMELIKEIALDKLVIMVTHNEKLADTYANRIVKMQDGKIIDDNNPIKKTEKDGKDYCFKKTAMSFFTALNLSFNNIITKKGRTLITAFASSIGIIGIALILSLSNGFDIQIKKFEADTLSSLPIVISEQTLDLDEETMMKLQQNYDNDEFESYPKKDIVYAQKPLDEELTHTNTLTKEYMNYIEELDSEKVSGISYTRITNLNVIGRISNSYVPIDSRSFNFLTIPRKLDDTSTGGVIEDNYDVLYGNLPTNETDLVLILDSKNRVSTDVLEVLNLDISKDSFSFDDIIGRELRIILNDDYYKSLGNYYTINTDYDRLYNLDSAVTLKVVGIIRGKEDKKYLTQSNSGLIYTDKLMDYVISKNSTSNIVKLQEKSDYNVLTGEKFSNDETGIKTKENILSYLGMDGVPMAISIYPKDFNSKDDIISYLDKYNEGKNETEKIVYTDLGDTISSLSGNIMDAITVVLIAFSAISLVVSSIMIGIITYISVLERTKEIGILRALGARKKDIRRVFNAETFIIGICSGTLGLIIARLLVFPANSLIYNLTDLPNVAKLNPLHALILMIISVSLTMIGGYIPARIASNKDAVIALRTE